MAEMNWTDLKIGDVICTREYDRHVLIVILSLESDTSTVVDLDTGRLLETANLWRDDRSMSDTGWRLYK